MQTGDPTGTGRGGESVYRSAICIITFLSEHPKLNTPTPFLFVCVISKLYGDQARFFDAEKAPRIKHRKKGTVSMVNNGNDQHGSQVNGPFHNRNLRQQSHMRPCKISCIMCVSY